MFAVCILFCACNENTLSKVPPKSGTMPENLTDFTLCLDGDILTFPTEYKTLTDLGWTIDKENEDVRLSAGEYNSASLSKDGKKVMFYFANFTTGAKILSDCRVCGLSVSYNDGVPTLLPNNIYLGYADKKSVKSAYGGKIKGKSATFDVSENAKITLGFSENILTSIDMYNIVDDIKVSSEIPPEIKAYKSPKELSDNLKKFTFYLSGTVYTFPLPVRELISGGFIKANTTVDYVMPGETVKKAIKLTKLNRTLVLDVKNIASVPTTVENCVVLSIVSTYSEKLDITLAGGVRAGAYESALSVFDKKQFTEIKTDKKHKTYIYKDKKHGKISVRVNRATGIINKLKIEYK